jgi:voltage-gated potassium channel
MTEPSTREARRAAIQCLLSVVVLFTAYAVLPLRGDRWWLGAVIGAAVIIALVPMTVRRLRAVLTSDRPVLEAVEAVVRMLVMLIVGYAAVYYAMDRESGQFTGLDTRIDALYFTVTTLSTVGFGDITASGQAARVVVTVQIAFNLAFLGIVVRAFANVAGRRHRERAPKA